MSRQMCKIASAVGDVDFKRLRIICQKDTCTIVPEPGWAWNIWPRAEGVIALNMMTAVAQFVIQYAVSRRATQRRR